MADTFIITVEQPEQTPSVSIVHLGGELDSSCIKPLHVEFVKLVADKKTLVIVEMAEVSFLSSIVLGELAGLKKTMVEHGGNLVLAGMKLELKTQLNAIGASKLFSFYKDLRSAVMVYSWEYGHSADVVEVKFQPNLKYVPPVRHFVGRVAKQKGYSDRDCFRIETIIDEICNNAIEHGSINPDHEVSLQLRVMREKIEIIVVNRNNPEKIAAFKMISGKIASTKEGPALPAADNPRGRGLKLIKMLASSVCIEFSDNGTIVHITKIREE